MADEREWFPFQPELGQHVEEFTTFATRLAEATDLKPLRLEVLRELDRAKNGALPLHMVQSIALDLADQGWGFSVDRDGIACSAPSVADECSASAKTRIRQGHAFERSAHLREPSVQDFIAAMEQRRLTANGWHSIYSLMRDGRELGAKLAAAATLEGAAREKALAAAIDPYIQFVDPDVVDEHTGLLLTDIWRYFRMTWVNMHKSVPGRTMMILIRDRAAAQHPVIGIAALASAVAQLDLRDSWIGWNAAAFLDHLDNEGNAADAKWLHASIDNLLDAIYLKDLLKEKIISKALIATPTEDLIRNLRDAAAEAKKKHHQNADAAAMKRKDVAWEEKALLPLFRAKRCEALAKLLGIRLVFQKVGFSTGSKKALDLALSQPSARTAIGQLVRAVKSEHVGIDMMDITVCGAVAPYNRVLGGKLVCTLLTSPEVVQAYKRRYDGQESIIASSIKGAPVRRTPRLVLLSTTSLYGRGSSQYNRVKIPAGVAGGADGDVVEYRHLGHSKGFGTFHFSAETVRVIDTLLARRQDGKRVNSIFGEGVNPRMRKIREALESVRLPSDAILNHGVPRVVYGIALASNFRDVLLGRQDKPRYVIPQTKPAERSARLAAFWRTRWLSNRINDPAVLSDIAEHTLSYPVTHGARVVGPPIEGDENETLW